MRIVYLSNAIIPSRYANSVHVMKMSAAFARNGHEVTLIHPNSLTMEEEIDTDIFSHYGVEGKFQVLKVDWLPKFILLSLKPLLKIKLLLYFLLILKRILYPLAATKKIRSINPDIIYSRYLPPLFWLCGTNPEIYFENHNPPDEFRWLSSYFFKKLISASNFKRLIVISQPLRDDYKMRNPSLDESRLLVAHDGADPVSKADKILLQRENYFNVGYTGQLYKGRGIELIETLAKSMPDCSFHLIGGNDKEIQYWKEHTSNVGNLFFYGFVPPAKINGYLASMDVLLAPYQRKVTTSMGTNTVDRMSPLKIFEYMAAGKPIVSSDLPVLHEILEDRKNCLLCDPENIVEWRNAILKLRDEPDFARRIAETAKSHFLDKYTWQRRAERVISS